MSIVGSGATRVGCAPIGMVPPSFQFKFGEGFNRSIDVRNLKLWQYKHFVKNGRCLFLGKIDAEETFLWISSTIGIFGSMVCPMECRVRIITSAF